MAIQWVRQSSAQPGTARLPVDVTVDQQIRSNLASERVRFVYELLDNPNVFFLTRAKRTRPDGTEIVEEQLSKSVGFDEDIFSVARGFPHILQLRVAPGPGATPAVAAAEVQITETVTASTTWIANTFRVGLLR